METTIRWRNRSSNASGGGCGSKPWTSQLSKAEQNISLSSQRLEHAFKDTNHYSLQLGSGPHNPSPIKMIRRLTALEIAIGQLRQDCETISGKRKNIVQSVISDQNQNLANTKKVCLANAYTNICFCFTRHNEEFVHS